MKRTALIVGAGIGGLAAAIAPRQAGWNVRLFESAATAREIGSGLGVAPTPSRRSGGASSRTSFFWHAASPRREVSFGAWTARF